MKNCCYFTYVIWCIITKRQKERWSFRVIDKWYDVSNRWAQVILCAGLRKSYNQWEEFYGVCNACAMCGWDRKIHATVMINSRTDLPSISSSRRPRTMPPPPFRGKLHGYQGEGEVVLMVKNTIECCICRKFRIEATIEKNIQRDCCLGKKIIPLFGRILGIFSTEVSNKLWLKGLNGPLCSITSMNMGSYYLVLDNVLKSSCFNIDKALLSKILLLGGMKCFG